MDSYNSINSINNINVLVLITAATKGKNKENGMASYFLDLARKAFIMVSRSG